MGSCNSCCGYRREEKWCVWVARCSGIEERWAHDFSFFPVSDHFSGAVSLSDSGRRCAAFRIMMYMVNLHAYTQSAVVSFLDAYSPCIWFLHWSVLELLQKCWWIFIKPTILDCRFAANCLPTTYMNSPIINFSQPVDHFILSVWYGGSEKPTALCGLKALCQYLF